MLELAESVKKSHEGERWPPVLKAVEECVMYDFVEPYLDRFDFEDDPLLYPFKDILPLHLCQKFLKQVRESWGYAVNVMTPGSPFYPSSFLVVDSEDFQTFNKARCKDLVGKINNKAKEHGEFYVFDEIKKAVMVPVGSLMNMLITFTVREVSSNKLETVRVCFQDGTTLAQWGFRGEGQYEDEDEDEDEDRVIYTLPADWAVICEGEWKYAE